MRELHQRNAYAYSFLLSISRIILTFPSEIDYQRSLDFARVVNMKDRELVVIISAAFFILICVAIMVFMHEQHYRKRRVIINPEANIEDRISNIERILLEDRYT